MLFHYVRRAATFLKILHRHWPRNPIFEMYSPNNDSLACIGHLKQEKLVTPTTKFYKLFVIIYSLLFRDNLQIIRDISYSYNCFLLLYPTIKFQQKWHSPSKTSLSEQYLTCSSSVHMEPS